MDVYGKIFLYRTQKQILCGDKIKNNSSSLSFCRMNVCGGRDGKRSGGGEHYGNQEKGSEEDSQEKGSEEKVCKEDNQEEGYQEAQIVLPSVLLVQQKQKIPEIGVFCFISAIFYCSRMRISAMRSRPERS
jgi:hypothetical protein